MSEGFKYDAPTPMRALGGVSSTRRLEYEFSNTGYRMASSLPLQMAFYFNIVLFPFWLLMLVCMAYVKFDCMTHLSRCILVTALIAIVLNECLRLYLGFAGNVHENASELVVSWMLSLLLQLPAQLFLLIHRGTRLIPPELTLHSIMILLLLIQICTGYRALRVIMKRQLIRFQILRVYLGTDYDDDDVEEEEEEEKNEEEKKHRPGSKKVKAE